MTSTHGCGAGGGAGFRTPEQMCASCSASYTNSVVQQEAIKDKTEFLCCVIQKVRLTTKGNVDCAEVVWQGGACSELSTFPSTWALRRLRITA